MNNRQEGQSVPNTPSDTDDRSDTGTPRQLLSRLKSFHFHSIRTRGLAVSTGLVLIVVIVVKLLMMIVNQIRHILVI